MRLDSCSHSSSFLYASLKQSSTTLQKFLVIFILLYLYLSTHKVRTVVPYGSFCFFFVCIKQAHSRTLVLSIINRSVRTIRVPLPATSASYREESDLNQIKRVISSGACMTSIIGLGGGPRTATSHHRHATQAAAQHSAVPGLQKRKTSKRSTVTEGRQK